MSAADEATPECIRCVQLMTVNQVMAAMQISRSQVYRLFESGELAWVRIGAHRRVGAIEVARYIEANTRTEVLADEDPLR